MSDYAGSFSSCCSDRCRFADAVLDIQCCRVDMSSVIYIWWLPIQQLHSWDTSKLYLRHISGAPELHWAQILSRPSCPSILCSIHLQELDRCWHLPFWVWPRLSQTLLVQVPLEAFYWVTVFEWEDKILGVDKLWKNSCNGYAILITRCLLCMSEMFHISEIKFLLARNLFHYSAILNYWSYSIRRIFGNSSRRMRKFMKTRDVSKFLAQNFAKLRWFQFR